MNGLSIAELRSHVPIDAVIQNGEPQIEWLRIADAKFNDPFFHETVERIRRERPQLRSVYTDLDALLQVAKLAKASEPSGLILHTSRCGSTLVANACRALGGARIFAEAPVVDKLVSRLFTDAPHNSTRELLYLTLVRAAIEILGRSGDESTTPYVVKFAAASILQISRIRRICPTVPIVILYRHPLEILVSNLRNPPHWMVIDNNPLTAAAIAGVGVDQLREMSSEEFCALSLGRFYSAAETIAHDPSVMFLDYDELSLETLQSVVEFFGVARSSEELSAIESATRAHSKEPGRSFSADAAEKRQGASYPAVQMTEKWAMPAYRHLVELTKQLRSGALLNTVKAN